jgi:hypothetical protein
VDSNILNEFIDGDINSMNLRDVINMLSKKWNNLSITQKSDIAQYIAGTR